MNVKSCLIFNLNPKKAKLSENKLTKKYINHIKILVKYYNIEFFKRTNFSFSF